MPLTPGTRLGPYEIVSAIGAGGMSARGYAEPWFDRLTMSGRESARPELVEGQFALGVGPQRQ